jgi:hypothetical protein
MYVLHALFYIICVLYVKVVKYVCVKCDYAYAWSDKNEDCKQCDDKLPYVWDKTTETCGLCV